MFIAFCGIFIYNVEVSTRLIFSTSPFIYIVIARIISEYTSDVTIFYKPILLCLNYERINLLVISYLFGYCFIGTALHVNWLPFL